MLNRSIEPATSINTKIEEINYGTDILKNNISLYSIKDWSKDVCGLEIIFEGGQAEEEKKGASYFSTNLLKSGINGYDSDQINNFLELRGAFVQAQSGLDYNSLSLYCLSNKLEETLPFFLNLFANPTFPEEKIKKLKVKKEQELIINEQKSSYWASKLLKQSLFHNHPYGNSFSKEGIKTINRESIIEHWHSKSLNQIQFITIAGNFNKSHVISQIESSIELQTISPKKQIEYLTRNKKSTLSKKIKDSTQSTIKTGCHIINLAHNHYPALSLANTILGGYFGSRLMQNIREEKGLTYGINSSIIHLKQISYFQVSADIKAGVGEEVLKLIEEKINDLRKSPIPIKEINKVKNYLIGEYKSNSETIFDKINKVKFLKSKNLDNFYYQNHFNKMLAVQSTDINDVLATHLSPANMSRVIID